MKSSTYFPDYNIARLKKLKGKTKFTNRFNDQVIEVENQDIKDVHVHVKIDGEDYYNTNAIESLMANTYGYNAILGDEVC